MTALRDATTVQEAAQPPARFPIRRVLLCLSGSAAAAFAPTWIYWARATLGVQTRVVATEAALTFVTIAALRALSGHEVAHDDTTMSSQGTPIHVALVRWAELVLVAPATANTVAKLAAGIADNLVCSVVLHSPGPVVVAPSLNHTALAAPATVRNLAQLREDGIGVVPTTEGISVVDGTESAGAMPDASTVFEFAAAFMNTRTTGGAR